MTSVPRRERPRSVAPPGPSRRVGEGGVAPADLSPTSPRAGVRRRGGGGGGGGRGDSPAATVPTVTQQEALTTAAAEGTASSSESGKEPFALSGSPPWGRPGGWGARAAKGEGKALSCQSGKGVRAVRSRRVWPIRARPPPPPAAAAAPPPSRRNSHLCCLAVLQAPGLLLACYSVQFYRAIVQGQG